MADDDPYRPPQANVEIEVDRGPRPQVVVLTIGLFLLYLVADSAVGWHQDEDGDSLLVIGVNAILLALAAGLWNGRSWAPTWTAVICCISAVMYAVDWALPIEGVNVLHPVVNALLIGLSTVLAGLSWRARKLRYFGGPAV